MRRLLVLASLGLAALGASTLEACKGPMAKIEAMRDALLADDAGAIAAATAGYPACPDPPPGAAPPGATAPPDEGCLAAIATALGSQRGFAPDPPDQAAAATAALALLRDGRGDRVSNLDTWLGAIKAGTGTGLDTLRLAVARKMAEAAPLVGRAIDRDEDALATMKAVAGALPGACPTYRLLASGADPRKLPPELSAEHSACVHRDLKRREGPGGSYGEGTLRALEGSLAAWRETERALRLGVTKSSPQARAVLERKLALIEPATRAIATKKLPNTAPIATLHALGDLHADAGVVLWKPRDAGPDAPAPQPGPPPVQFGGH